MYLRDPDCDVTRISCIITCTSILVYDDFSKNISRLKTFKTALKMFSTLFKKYVEFIFKKSHIISSVNCLFTCELFQFDPHSKLIPCRFR